MTWQPPVVTRWWIEGDGTDLYRVEETSADRDAPPCAMPSPVRADHDWLSNHGIGVSLEFHGAHGWVEEITRIRERPPRAQGVLL